MSVLDVSDGVGVVLEHSLGPLSLNSLLLNVIILALKLLDDGEESFDGGDELLEGVGEYSFMLGDPIVLLEDRL